MRCRGGDRKRRRCDDDEDSKRHQEGCAYERVVYPQAFAQPIFSRPIHERCRSYDIQHQRLLVNLNGQKWKGVERAGKGLFQLSITPVKPELANIAVLLR